jgi:hypothetical protein
MNRLHEKGFISNPVGKAKSVLLTERGLVESEKLLWKIIFEALGTQFSNPTDRIVNPAFW